MDTTNSYVLFSELSDHDDIQRRDSFVRSLFGSNQDQLNNNPNSAQNPPFDPLGFGGVISSVFGPIASGLQPSSTAASTTSLTAASSQSTSSTSAASTETSSSSSSSLTSSSSASASSSLSDTSSSATSSTNSQTSTTSQSNTSQAGSASLTPSINPTPTSSSSDLTGQATSAVASSDGPTSTVSNKDAKSSSFFSNKPLSIGVITAASIVGLILLVILATCALRRRRNKRLDADDDFNVSTFGLVAEHHGAEDVEKSGALAIKSRGTATGSSESVGSGGSASVGNVSRALTRPQAAYDANQNWMQSAPAAPRENYDRTGYPALPVFMSVPDQTQRGALGASSPPMDFPYLPSPYDVAAVPQNTTYAQPTNGVQRRTSNGYRKKPPTLSPLDVMAPPASQDSAPPSPMTAVSLSNTPLQPARDMNPANPTYGEPAYQMPFQHNAPPPRRGSLLPSVANAPQSVASPPGLAPPGSTSHARSLDPLLKALSTPSQYVNGDFVNTSPSADDNAARRLVIRNE